MELRKTATGAAEPDGRTAGGPITAGAPVPSSEPSRGGSGGDERAERRGRRPRGKGNPKLLRTLPKQLTWTPKHHGEGGNVWPGGWEGSGATGRAQNRLGGKAGTGRWKDSSRGHFRDDELTGGKIRPGCGRVRGESPDGGREESRVGVGPGEDRSLCRHHLPNAQQGRRPG